MLQTFAPPDVGLSLLQGKILIGYNKLFKHDTFEAF